MHSSPRYETLLNFVRGGEKEGPPWTVWKWAQKRKAMPSQEIEARLLYALSYTGSRATN